MARSIPPVPPRARWPRSRHLHSRQHSPTGGTALDARPRVDGRDTCAHPIRPLHLRTLASSHCQLSPFTDNLAIWTTCPPHPAQAARFQSAIRTTWQPGKLPVTSTKSACKEPQAATDQVKHLGHLTLPLPSPPAPPASTPTVPYARADTPPLPASSSPAATSAH